MAKTIISTVQRKIIKKEIFTFKIRVFKSFSMSGSPCCLSHAHNLQVAVTCQDMLQFTNKDREDIDCKSVNMDESNAGFKMVSKMAFQMFYVEGNAFNTFVRAQ